MGTGAGDDRQPVGRAPGGPAAPSAAGVDPDDLRGGRGRGGGERRPGRAGRRPGRLRRPGRIGAARVGARGRRGRARTQAATWVAGQVSSAETVGCDPLMCAALRAHGVAASRLLPAGGGRRPALPAPAMLVASVVRPADSRARRCCWPASGPGPAWSRSGPLPPGGAAAYQRAVAGRPGRAPGRGHATAAQPAHPGRAARPQRTAPGGPGGRPPADHARDAGLAASLAGDRASAAPRPGCRSPRRRSGRSPSPARTPADLAASLALVRAQRAPYQPAQAAIVRLPGGQTALRIDFAAPSPLGLLTGGASG